MSYRVPTEKAHAGASFVGRYCLALLRPDPQAAGGVRMVLVAIVRKRLELSASLYQILQIVSVTIFEKEPILQLIEAFDSQSELLDNSKQLILFDL